MFLQPQALQLRTSLVLLFLLLAVLPFTLPLVVRLLLLVLEGVRGGGWFRLGEECGELGLLLDTLPCHAPQATPAPCAQRHR